MADLDAESDIDSASYLFEWEIYTKKTRRFQISTRLGNGEAD